jgi:hypothetical protein
VSLLCCFQHIYQMPRIALMTLNHCPIRGHDGDLPCLGDIGFSNSILQAKKNFRETNHDALYRLQSPKTSVKASRGFSPARSLLRHRPNNLSPQTPFDTFLSSFSVFLPSHQAGHSGREWVIRVDLISVQE